MKQHYAYPSTLIINIPTHISKVFKILDYPIFLKTLVSGPIIFIFLEARLLLTA